MNNGDMPAMPLEVIDEVQSSRWWSGMTKREMMAMHFHAALLSAHNEGVWSAVGCGAAAGWAVKEADSLLAELERAK